MVESRRNLLAAFEAGRERWPGVALPLEDFARRMDALEIDGEDLALRGPDLYLAAACATGDEAALRHFDAAFVSDVGRRLARFDLSDGKLDEVRQRIRTKLFVGPAPGIGGYRGRAPLSAWLHVTAVRVATDVAAIGGSRGTEVEIVGLIAPEQTPEIETARNMYGERFREALEASFAALTPREKTILRLHVVDGLNIDAIGAIYAVHRATAARWLVGIRARVYDRLKKDFEMRWNASSSELRSLVWLLRDQIHITAKRVLDAG